MSRVFGTTAGVNFLSKDQDPSLGTEWSWSCWCRTSINTASTRVALYYGEGDDQRNYYFLGLRGQTDDAGGVFGARYELTGTANAVTSNTWTLGAWTHLVGTANGDSDRTVVMNGDYGNLGNNTEQKILPSTAHRIAVGELEDSSPGAPFGGDIAHFAMWNNIQLSQGQIEALYMGMSPLLIAPTKLMFYFPLRSCESGDAQSVKTASGLSDTLTETGTVTGTEDPVTSYPSNYFIPNFPVTGGGGGASPGRLLLLGVS